MANNRCSICITEDCGGKKNCDCESCEKRDKCNRVLTPIIRITRKCTQECNHCCFSCSPKRDEHMSVAMASNISRFIESNNIRVCSIMGGEFFCNPDWEEILHTIIPKVSYCRLVTNGDWGKNTEVLKSLVPYTDKMMIAISEDRWHTNKYTRQAKEQCEELGFNWSTPTSEMQSEMALVPVGNLQFDPVGIFGLMGTYCSNPAHHYSFLIDENGDIFKCGFGIWDYANVNDHLEGDFAERFKEFNQLFYKQWISSCKTCVRCYNDKGKE